eukprot:scaffold183132_cov35-Prasinocladus_malaysianus.AAC.1
MSRETGPLWPQKPNSTRLVTIKPVQGAKILWAYSPLRLRTPCLSPCLTLRPLQSVPRGSQYIRRTRSSSVPEPLKSTQFSVFFDLGGLVMKCMDRLVFYKVENVRSRCRRSAMASHKGGPSGCVPLHRTSSRSAG